MSLPVSNRLDGVLAAGASTGAQSLVPFISTVAPASTNILGPFGPFKVGQRWINISTNAEYVLTSFSSSNGATTADWEISAGGSFLVSTLTGDSGGAVSPSSGNINTLGTANQITVTGTPSSHQLVWSIPSVFTAPGSIASTTTLTAGTSLAVTTSATIGTGLTITSGGETITAGNLTLSGTGAGFVLPVVVVAAGGSPQVANGRVVQVTFSSVSIAAGATQTLTITNSAIASSSTNLNISMWGATTGAALTIQSVTPNTGTVAIVVQNGTGATTTTANITFSVLVLD